MPKVWEIKPKVSDDLLEQLLHNRGLGNEDEIKKFFDPKLSDFQSDFELKGIDSAKKRILEATQKNELIVVYGDYDVDGICGAAVLYLGLTAIGAKVLPYIPHREKEGYGLSKLGLDLAKEKGAALVITVDNGIVAHIEADYAKSLGLDLIITDHHIPLDTKPQSLSIVHSTKMCGAAVAWCLVKNLVSENISQELLDLVAIATICDIIPLVGVNRAFVKTGLIELNKTTKIGLLALIDQSGLELGNISAQNVSHILGPRLNAIGRLEHSIEALRLLCTKDTEKARKLAKLICDSNDLKKKIAGDAITQAKLIIEEENSEGKNVLVVYSKDWVPGIIGLVAGRMCDEYQVPVVVISEGEKESKGSARSVNGLDIVATIRKCSDFLLDIGGHPKAAGFTVETTKIKDFKKKLEEIMEMEEFDKTEKLVIETEIPAKKINRKILEVLETLEPVGEENPKPILASFNMRLSDLKAVGDGQHLKFKAEGVDAIAFSFGNWIKILKEGQLINVAYLLELNKFNGSEKLQLRVVDLQLP